MSMEMEIFTYGVTTSRYNSSLLWNKDKLITSLGSNLGIWDLGSLTRERVLQYNSNVVMVLIENKNYIFSVSYSGEVCILDKNSLDLVLKTTVEGRCVRHASVTDDYLVVNAEIGPDKCKGVMTVFSLKKLQSENTIEAVFVLKGRYKYSHVLSNGKLFTTKENILNEDEREAWRVMKRGDSAVKKETKPKKTAHYVFKLFDIETKAELHSQSFEHFSSILSSQSNNHDLIDMLYLDRTLVSINPLTFETILKTKIAGTGAILSTALIERSSFFSPKPGVLVQIKLDSVKNFPELFEFDKQQLDCTAVYKLPGSGIDSKIFAFLLQDPNTGVICFEDGINVIDLVKNKVRSVSCFNITCCGIALSSDGELVACGDFSGNVNLFSTQSNLSVEPLAKAFIMESIRTLAFDSKNESVIIGTMSGRLIRWWIQDIGGEPRPIATFTNSVLNIRYNYHHDGHRYLIAGLSNGMFAIFKEVELEHNMHYILGHYGHMPSTLPVNLDFGSLTHYAEIWSAVWSATSNNFFVTASEDQTCCVWDITQKNPNLVHKLTGHTKAVTSVDWRVMDERLGELFISCSDDQTARVYDPKDSFKLLFTLSTSFINEWHTLTYLSLEEGGTRVAIGSQNGFLFIYDLLNKEFTFAERIHNGSVEGLDWKGNTVVTCSADNTISVVKIPKSSQKRIESMI